MANSDLDGGVGDHPHQREALLLLGRPADGGAAAYCRDHLAPRVATDATPLVVRAAHPMADWHDTAPPGVVIAVGDVEADASVHEFDPHSERAEVVTAGTDLVAVGETVEDVLRAWSAADHRPVVCVDSITGLLEAASIEAVYRLLFVLLRRVEASGGSVHAHANPYVHEEEILRTYFALFDRVVSFQDGGSALP